MTATTHTQPGAVEWDRLASRFSDTLRDVYAEGPRADAYSEALRRTFGYVAAGDPGSSGRALPYEHLNRGQGLTTDAEASWIRDAHTVADRLAREAAERQVKEMRAEVARVYQEAAKDLAAFLRDRCNERTVPSRFRREGVRWAADMIDPSVPKDQFGNVRSDGAR